MQLKMLEMSWMEPVACLLFNFDNACYPHKKNTFKLIFPNISYANDIKEKLT